MNAIFLPIPLKQSFTDRKEKKMKRTKSRRRRTWKRNDTDIEEVFESDFEDDEMESEEEEDDEEDWKGLRAILSDWRKVEWIFWREREELLVYQFLKR